MDDKAYTVSFVLHYRISTGVVDVNVGAVTTMDELQSVVRDLMRVITSAIDEFNAASKDGIIAKHQTSEKNRDKPEDNWILVDKLWRSTDRRGTYIRAVGGPYQSYGVVVWPNFVEQWGFDPQDIPSEGYKPEGKLWINVSKAGDKPRVIGVWKGER